MNKQTISPKTVQIVNIVAFVLVLTINILSNAIPFNGVTAGEVSDALPSYFTPAGYTFSIWSLIYLALLGFTIYQALPSQRERPFLRQIGWLFALSSVFNSTWLLAWHYGFYPLSVLLMLGILATLAAIYYRLRIGRPNEAMRWQDKLFYHFPFSIYLGWITVATIANISSVLNFYGWGGFGIAEPMWSAIMMLVAAVLVGILLFNRRDFGYAGVLVWALFGIRAAYVDVPLVANTAVFTAVAIALLAVAGFLNTRREQQKGSNQQATSFKSVTQN